MDKLNWSIWKKMPSPQECRSISGPDGPGIYQIKNCRTKEYVLFGISQNCRKRMKSFFPKPYGTGTRNNEHKRIYILENWKDLEYRTFQTKTRAEAKLIEDKIKALQIHLYNT